MVFDVTTLQFIGKAAYANSGISLKPELAAYFCRMLQAQDFQTQVLDSLQQRAKQRRARIALVDAEDPRTQKAAVILRDKEIATVRLVGDESTIKASAREAGVDLQDIEICDPKTLEKRDELVASLLERRRSKGMSPEQADESFNQPLIAAGMILAHSMVDACVGGSLSSTGSVLRAALMTNKLQDSVSTLSSFFLMILRDRVLAYADCAVVPEPNAVQLSDIARSTARNYEKLSAEHARIALLSFSTKGSAEHATLDVIRKALQHIHEQSPELIVDGELQADAALVPSVAERKAPGSVIHGDANVLVFPNLSAGNIAYKLTERLAGAVALGPIVQGLERPYCDLSRGCSVDDIVNTCCIAIVMS